MNLENIMLSKISQSQRNTYCIILFIQNVPNVEKIDQWLPGAVGREIGGNGE